MIDDQTSIDGCFETMLFYERRLRLAEAHFERLGRSLEFLEWSMPDNLSIESVENEIMASLEQHGFSKDDRLRCRLTVSKEIGSQRTKWRIEVTILEHPISFYRLKSINLDDPVFLGFARHCKLTSRDKYFDTLNQAIKFGYDDALLTVESGIVSESCIANIFWVKDDVFYTPNSTSGQLFGLGLEYLSNALISSGYSMVSDRYKLDSILKSDMVWIINSVRGPIPIAKIDTHEIPLNSVISELIDDLFWRNIP